MAEIAVAAQDLPTGYKKGDPISVLPFGADRGILDTLPNIWWINIPDATIAELAPWFIGLYSDAQPGDPEFDNPDLADRRIWRHRRGFRFMADELPAFIENTLEATGEIVLSRAQASPFLRRLTWNESEGKPDKTPDEVLTP